MPSVICVHFSHLECCLVDVGWIMVAIGCCWVVVLVLLVVVGQHMMITKSQYIYMYIYSKM